MAKQIKTRAARPVWDAEARELRLGSAVVKWFRRSARNQELLLQAFEESGWASEIDDPLPQRGGVKPSDRLRATAKSLNRKILDHLLEFGVTDHGTRATWHLRYSSHLPRAVSGRRPG